MKIKNIFILGALFALFSFAFFGFNSVQKAKANPVFFPITTQTAAATTTTVTLTAGTATTTLSVDAYTSGTPSGLLKGTLFIQFAGTSTASSLRINQQYSQDNVDWYQDTGTLANGFATSTIPINLDVAVYNLQFASSTVSGAGGNATITTRAVSVQSATRYTRFVFSMPAGSLNGMLWAQFVPQKEYPNNG